MVVFAVLFPFFILNILNPKSMVGCARRSAPQGHSAVLPRRFWCGYVFYSRVWCDCALRQKKSAMKNKKNCVHHVHVSEYVLNSMFQGGYSRTLVLFWSRVIELISVSSCLINTQLWGARMDRETQTVWTKRNVGSTEDPFWPRKNPVKYRAPIKGSFTVACIHTHTQSESC